MENLFGQGGLPGMGPEQMMQILASMPEQQRNQVKGGKIYNGGCWWSAR